MTSNVLAPIDIADEKTLSKVLAAAVVQTKALEGTLYVMAVVPDIVAGLDWRYAIRGETGGSAEFDMSKLVAECLKRLNEIVEKETPSGMTVKTIARHGSVYEQVLKVAEEIDAEQIVIGAHRPGHSEFHLGPNAARIVRHAKCSVNVIRPQ